MHRLRIWESHMAKAYFPRLSDAILLYNIAKRFYNLTPIQNENTKQLNFLAEGF